MTSDGPTLTVERAAEVSEETTVRHVDQLSDATRRALRTLADGETRPVPGLEAGEIVVATTYYRVACVETPAEEAEAETVRA
ncbi:hypothetical protein RYH80_12405 [Halobaculum sp. MBLA0147]|uniref:hypothetical protein n=1 Tax=Halobaculum sp. MBLA0147 TaxID=3079934 RepID=UPI003523BA7C